MKFSPKCRVLCLELKQYRRQLKKGRGAAGKGKRGGPPLHIELAGALELFANIGDPDQMPHFAASDLGLMNILNSQNKMVCNTLTSCFSFL